MQSYSELPRDVLPGATQPKGMPGPSAAGQARMDDEGFEVAVGLRHS